MDTQMYSGARAHRSMGLVVVVAIGLLMATGCGDTDGALVTVTLPENAVLLSTDGEPLLDSDRVHFELFVAEQNTTVVDGVRALERQFDNDDLMKDVTIAQLRAGYDVQLTSATPKTIQIAVAVWSGDDDVPALTRDITFAPLEVNVEPGSLRTYNLPLVTQPLARTETQPQDCDGEVDSRVAGQAYVWGTATDNNNYPDWHCLRWTEDADGDPDNAPTLATMTRPDDRDCDGPLQPGEPSCRSDEFQCDELDTRFPDGTTLVVDALQQLDVDNDGYTDEVPGHSYMIDDDGRLASCMACTENGMQVTCDCPLMKDDGGYVSNNYAKAEACDGYDNDCDPDTWFGLDHGDVHTFCGGGPSNDGVCGSGRIGCVETNGQFDDEACAPETNLHGQKIAEGSCVEFLCSQDSCTFTNPTAAPKRDAVTSTILATSTVCPISEPLSQTVDFSPTATCTGLIWGSDDSSRLALVYPAGSKCNAVELRVSGDSVAGEYVVMLHETGVPEALAQKQTYPVRIVKKTIIGFSCPPDSGE